jgi:RsiW-degrading membrane proteinase PrsW (M82 family)
VQEAYEGSVDLYDIATWEVRSSVDRIAVTATSLFRQSRTVLLVGIAVLLFVVQVAVAGVIVIQEPFIGVLAVSSILPAVGVAGYLWYGDPTRREPFVALAVTFLLALLFAGFAGVVNSTVGPVFEALGVAGVVLFYFVVVGPVEEFVKWLAIRVYAYRKDTFRTVIDGVVYGAAAGVGFAAIENFIYIVNIYVEASGTAGLAPTEAATSVAVQRFLVGPGHVVFSAWAGFYLGLAKFNAENRGPIILKGLLVATFIHALYNTSVTVLPAFLPGLGVFGYIVLYDGFWFVVLYRKVRRYRELYRARYERTPTRGQERTPTQGRGRGSTRGQERTPTRGQERAQVRREQRRR